MVIEGLFDFIFSLLKFLFNLIPNMEIISLPSDLSTLFVDLVKSVGFFLPLSDFAMMFGIFMIVTNFRFFANIFHRIWDMLPLT